MFLFLRYNSSMEAENNLSKNNNEKEAVKAPEEKKSKKSLFVGVSLSVIVLVSVITAVIVTNIIQNNKKDDGTADDYSQVVEGDNTELTSGSVTTTIGGKSITYKAAYLVDGIDAVISSGVYESTNDDEVVFLVINGGSLKIDGEVTINKTGSESFQGRGDNYSFYGMNSAIVVAGEDSSVDINGAKINTSVSGANALVATDDATAMISATEIATSKDNSRGLHATYGGMINADNVAISTQGGSCATLATDRGAGTVVANNMTLSTAGAGSPLIYSTGKITVTNSTGTATGAQIAVVEGKNSISLQGCEFSANGNGNRNGVDNAGVMIYQSMSGDASVGTGSFTATDCILTVLSSSNVYNETPFFFITNTDATIDLTSTNISFSASEKFISALGTSEWGRSGNNGGNVTISLSDINATNMEIESDSISSVSGI